MNTRHDEPIVVMAKEVFTLEPLYISEPPNENFGHLRATEAVNDPLQRGGGRGRGFGRGRGRGRGGLPRRAPPRFPESVHSGVSTPERRGLVNDSRARRLRRVKPEILSLPPVKVLLHEEPVEHQAFTTLLLSFGLRVGFRLVFGIELGFGFTVVLGFVLGSILHRRVGDFVAVLHAVELAAVQVPCALLSVITSWMSASDEESSQFELD